MKEGRDDANESIWGLTCDGTCSSLKLALPPLHLETFFDGACMSLKLVLTPYPDPLFIGDCALSILTALATPALSMRRLEEVRRLVMTGLRLLELFSS